MVILTMLKKKLQNNLNQLTLVINLARVFLCLEFILRMIINRNHIFFLFHIKKMMIVGGGE